MYCFQVRAGYLLQSLRLEADQKTEIDCAARVSHATTAIDSHTPLTTFRRESSTFMAMESATPKKFKSNILAALDLKSSIDDLETFNPLPSQTKRKRAPGSPDPRQSKRVAASVRSSIPGLENVICESSSVVNSTWDLISLIFSLRGTAATTNNGRITEGSPSRVRH